jgi:hypothetical protein
MRVGVGMHVVLVRMGQSRRWQSIGRSHSALFWRWRFLLAAEAAAVVSYTVDVAVERNRAANVQHVRGCHTIDTAEKAHKTF